MTAPARVIDHDEVAENLRLLNNKTGFPYDEPCVLWVLQTVADRQSVSEWAVQIWARKAGRERYVQTLADPDGNVSYYFTQDTATEGEWEDQDFYDRHVGPKITNVEEAFEDWYFVDESVGTGPAPERLKGRRYAHPLNIAGVIRGVEFIEGHSDFGHMMDTDRDEYLTAAADSIADVLHALNSLGCFAQELHGAKQLLEKAQRTYEGDFEREEEATDQRWIVTLRDPDYSNEHKVFGTDVQVIDIDTGASDLNNKPGWLDWCDSRWSEIKELPNSEVQAYVAGLVSQYAEHFQQDVPEWAREILDRERARVGAVRELLA